MLRPTSSIDTGDCRGMRTQRDSSRGRRSTLGASVGVHPTYPPHTTTTPHPPARCSPHTPTPLPPTHACPTTPCYPLHCTGGQQGTHTVVDPDITLTLGYTFSSCAVGVLFVMQLLFLLAFGFYVVNMCA